MKFLPSVTDSEVSVTPAGCLVVIIRPYTVPLFLKHTSCWENYTLILRPCPAFHWLQYGKVVAISCGSI